MPTARKKKPASVDSRKTAPPGPRPLLRAVSRVASLSEQVWEQLRRQIVHGERRPGERLVELDLAAEMGVSQGPVREALQRLESEGLVERQSHTATYVSEASIEEMYELSMIRKEVEGFSFRHAAQRITPQECGRLQDLVEQMRGAAQRQDIVTLESLDMTFHKTVCELSGSKILLRVWLPLFTQLQRFIVQAHHRYFSSLMEIADGHQPLVDALLTGDPERSCAALHEHIMVSWSRINTSAATPADRATAPARVKARR